MKVSIKIINIKIVGLVVFCLTIIGFLFFLFPKKMSILTGDTDRLLEIKFEFRQSEKFGFQEGEIISVSQPEDLESIRAILKALKESKLRYQRFRFPDFPEIGQVFELSLEYEDSDSDLLLVDSEGGMIYRRLYNQSKWFGFRYEPVYDMLRELYRETMIGNSEYISIPEGSSDRESLLKNLLAKYDIYRRLGEATKNISKESMDFNDLGYKAYQLKDWIQAIGLFGKAIETDPDNCFAYYNRACTLALQYGREVPAETVNLIIQDLTAAGERDPYFAVKMFIDKDLEHLRSIEYSASDYFPGGDCAPATITEYHNGVIEIYKSWDGTTYMGEPSSDGGPPENASSELTNSGFYVLIGGALFSYFKEDPYLQESKEYLFQVGRNN